MKKPDRDRMDIANTEILTAYKLLKLGARGFLDLHERHPDDRVMLNVWVDHHERQFGAVWDELIGKVRAADLLNPQPDEPDEDSAERMLATMRRATADLEQTLAFLRDVVQTRPERRDWAIKVVAGLRKWAMDSCTGFGRQLVAVNYLERLDKLGKPEPIGAEPGEPVRPVEPLPMRDDEYEAWVAANPEHRIDPVAAAEDFICRHSDKSVTRIGDIVGLYKKGLMDRPWGTADQTWDLALLEDIVLVRSCFVPAVTLRHLEWWMKPLRPVVTQITPDALVATAVASMNRLMSVNPMLVTRLKNHGWVPTHAGREAAEGGIMLQWRESAERAAMHC